MDDGRIPPTPRALILQTAGAARVYAEGHAAEPRLASCSQDLDAILTWAESEHRLGRHLVLQAYYELGLLLQGLRAPEGVPLLRIWSFVEPPQQVPTDDLPQPSAPAGLLWPAEGWPLDAPMPPAYAEQIRQAQQAIRAGETYQINLTQQLPISAYGDLLDLYLRLRQVQPTAHGAYLPATEGAGALLCFSPELFVEGCLPASGRAGWVETRPMKGTLDRALGDAAALASDTKNRAENVMIVDLLRNDLGQLAETGGVSVPSLFDVQAVGTVLQMTSTVRARLRADVGLAALLRATFPCGSITGAPKRQTMHWIAQLETAARGAYCGSVGWLDPDGRFSLNVVIRSLEQRQAGLLFGVGSGVTISSGAADEWTECQIKARFLRRLPSAVGLIETFGSDCPADRLQDHLSRMARSAAALAIPFDRESVEAAVAAVLKGDLSSRHRIRMALSAEGELRVESAPLTPLAAERMQVYWARDLLGPGKGQTRSHDPLLLHKTSRRAFYDEGWRAAEAAGGFDSLFVNERGEVTEGGRTSVFVRMGGRWRTPPLSCGVLPGILRQAWLDGQVFADQPAEEAVLRPDDLAAAEEIALVSSLRGRLRVSLARV